VKKSPYWLTVLFAIISFLLLTHCSLVDRTRRGLLGGAAKPGAATGKSGVGETVPREQYETLLSQYNDLKSKTESSQTPSLTSEEFPTSPTVSMGAEESMAPSLSNTSAMSATGDEFEELQKAILAFEIKKYDLSMNLLDKLTGSSEDQVKYRSRFYAGKILFARGEFNLAMQVFEDLLERYAFSGLSVESLQLAIQCAEKLGQGEKIKKLSELAKRLGLG